MTARLPAQRNADAAIPGLDDGPLQGAESHLLACREQVVAEFTVARQPGAPLDDAEHAAAPPEAHRAPRLDALHALGKGLKGGRVSFRIHHQSPSLHMAIIPVNRERIQ
ncbi:MAG: hypothetical protein ABIP61_14030 [Burkholderiaceae bacterium]